MTTLMRVILTIVVAAHGIGHSLFLLPLLGMSDWGQATRSWLLGGGGLAKGAGALIWFLALAGFLAAAIGLWRESAWWQTAAIVSAAVSTLGLLLFWGKPVSSPIISALVFNLLVLAALLVFHWPPIAQASR